MEEARPCPETPAPPGAWPGQLSALGAAPCRGPAAQSGPAAGAVPVSPASGGKLQHRAGAASALPRPNATAPGCSESGAQELHQPSEQPCHWGAARREQPPAGDQQQQQPPAGTATGAAICHEATLPPVAGKRQKPRSHAAAVAAVCEPKWLSSYIPAAGSCAPRPRRPLQERR